MPTRRTGFVVPHPYEARIFAEKTVDQAPISIWPFVGKEFVNFLWRRRQSSQIKAEPPDQCTPVRFR